MADAITNQILDEVIAVLAVDHRLAAGVYDLSAQGAVKRSAEGGPWLDGPCVAVQRSPVRTFREQDALGPIPLGRYGQEIDVVIHGWIPTPNHDDHADAERRATELADDLTRALQTARTLDGLVLDSHVEETDSPGLAPTSGGGAAARCVLTLTANWRATAGL